MIALLNTVIISLLFVFWVWTLKQDIATLRHASGPVPKAQEPVHIAAKPHEVLPNHHVGAPPSHDPFESAVKTRNRSGVPTWTIA